MITRPTVLVLGAGVSKSYGFWLGRDLVFEVLSVGDRWVSLIKNANKHDFEGQPLKAPPEFFILDNPGEPGNRQNIDKLIKFSETLRSSQLKSIDRFLGTFPDYLLIGKVAIAKVLIAQERFEQLMPSRKSERIYEFLWNTIWTSNPEDLEKNRLSIVTFNYDRSLEYALFTAIRHSYPNMDDARASQLLAKIPIIHVYGQLGRPEFERFRDEQKVARYRPYDTVDDVPALQACIQEIKLMEEERQEESDEFVNARELLKMAECIAFLGFGFDKVNMERLGKNRSFGNKGTKIYCTAYELGAYEIQVATQLINRYRTSEKTTSNEPVLINSDALQLLRNESILL